MRSATGQISITPIHVDLTRYQALEKVSGWVASLETEARQRRMSTAGDIAAQCKSRGWR